jgi:hypothetical protein
MNSSPAEIKNPTDEQAAIIDAPASERMLVIAAAGTGKTHVLASRLAKLIQIDGLQPGAELLVLSFSRAAVSEVRRRLTAAGTSLSHVSCTTFDAFATELLGSVNPDGDWQALDYDGRIGKAVHFLTQQPDDVRAAIAYRHILIDEAQDLVGLRASLVTELLSTLDCAFTLMGDPAQSIFNHQVRQKPEKLAVEPVIDEIRRTFSGQLTQRALTTNFRALTHSTRQTDDIGQSLRKLQPDYAAIRNSLQTFMLSQPFVGDLQVIAAALRTQDSEFTALLCRTNGEAMMVSRRLWELGVYHRLQRESIDRAGMPWIAVLLEHFPNLRVSRSQFLPRAVEFESQTGIDPESAWQLLKRLSPQRSDDLDIRALALRLRSGSIPEELNCIPAANVVVSTIHRAKGLEFDRIILAEPSPAGDTDTDESEELRLLYVAVTRARREVCIMTAPDTRGMRRLAQAGRRWVRQRFTGKTSRVCAMEIRSEDSCADHPPGAVGCSVDERRPLQEYIRGHVKPGDPIQISLRRGLEGRAQDWIYEFRHDGCVVGNSSRIFGAHLQAALGGARASPPFHITGARVDCVDTTIGDPLSAGIRGSGAVIIWSRVRVEGLGEFQF